MSGLCPDETGVDRAGGVGLGRAHDDRPAVREERELDRVALRGPLVLEPAVQQVPVALEAAAAGLPVVGVRSTGVVDAVADGITGTLVPRNDVGALANAIVRYARSERLRTCHGHAVEQEVDSLATIGEQPSSG